MPKDDRSPDELRTALGEHIGYELGMCMAAFEMLSHHSLGSDPVRHNALLEAGIVHARALVEFFTRKGHANDILREQFAPGWTPTPPDAVDHFDAALWDRMNREVGHLSWDRVDKPKRDWPAEQIARDIIAIAKSWNSHLGLTSPDFAAEFTPHVVAAEGAVNRTRWPQPSPGPGH